MSMKASAACLTPDVMVKMLRKGPCGPYFGPLGGYCLKCAAAAEIERLYRLIGAWCDADDANGSEEPWDARWVSTDSEQRRTALREVVGR